MCAYRDGGVSGYESMTVAYQKFLQHKENLQERDRKIYLAMQPLLDDVEMFMKSAMRELDRLGMKLIKKSEIGDITPVANHYKVSLYNGDYVFVYSFQDAEKLSKELKKNNV